MKKALNIIKNILILLIVIFAVLMMIFTIVSVNLFDRADRSIFGYKAFIVLSDSMSATDFSSGDLILVREVDPSSLQEGDIISFQSTNAENYGEIVTHKIRELTTDAEGNPGFITYGTTTGENDESVVTYEFVLGQYQTTLPGLGQFFSFLKTTPGYIVCIFLPFLLLIIIQGVNSIRLFRRYKKEQLEEMEAERLAHQENIKKERERLRSERLESQKLMEELIKLKREIAANGEAKASSSGTEDVSSSPADGGASVVTENGVAVSERPDEASSVISEDGEGGADADGKETGPRV